MRNIIGDYAAFVMKAVLVDFAYAKRDGEEPTLVEIKENQESILSTVEEFKKKNDERLAVLEKNGTEDPLLREEVDRIKDDLQKLTELRDQIAELQKKAARPGMQDLKETATAEQIEHREAFVSFLRKSDQEREKSALQEIERKAVTTTVDASGGYAVPEIISRRIERELSEVSPLRNLVDAQTIGSKDYKSLVDTRGAAYGWVGETDARAETGTPSLEEVAPTFGMIYAYPKTTEEALDDMFFDVEKWIVESVVEAFAEGEENAIILGNGTKKPTGFLNGTPTAQVDGTRPFGTLQFVASGLAGGFAATNPADPILDLIYQLKKGYRRNARFLMNKLSAGEVMKFKDGDGNYLWQTSAIAGQPDRFLGYSVAESEEMPDVAANAFPIAFGDFKAGYLLADLVGLRITKDEITEPGYVKFYVRRRVGGNVKKSEAIKLLKIAA